MIYIFLTCKDLEEGKKIARTLLEKRWIACASLIPHVESIYRWKGKIEQGSEAKAILKTKKELFEKVKEYILAHGSYETPEISEVAVGRANPGYLQWLSDEVSL